MKQSVLKFRAIFLISIIVVFSSCTNAPQETEANTLTSTFSLDSVKAAISASNTLFGEPFATGDSAKFANFYASDACIYASNMEKMCDSKAIAAFFNEGYKMGVRDIKLTTDEVMGAREAVVETGRYQLLADKDQVMDKGKYIVIWKEENGKWKMYRDIWNTDMPPVAPPVKK